MIDKDPRTDILSLPVTLPKHAYSNILKISPPKTESYQIKILIFSYFCSKHRLWVLVRTASQLHSCIEYPQSFSKNKKCIPQDKTVQSVCLLFIQWISDKLPSILLLHVLP